MIGSFSPSYNHREFSIFKDGGAKDPNNNSYQDLGFSGESLEDWERSAEEFYQSYVRASSRAKPPRAPHTESTSMNRWQVFLKDDYKNIKSATIQEKPLYIEFKKRVLAGKPPLDLLELSSIYTKEDVIKAYRKYARVVYPDQNTDKLEADALFKCLTEARYQLDPEARATFTAREPEKKS